jgi:hypothetical protein
MSFFISQEEDRGWRIETERLLEQLREQWPQAQIQVVRQPMRPYSHEWSIEIGAGLLEGKIDRAGLSVALDGSADNAAEFAAWFQNEVVGSNQHLLLYDEEFSRVAHLEPGVTAAGILAVLKQ